MGLRRVSSPEPKRNEVAVSHATKTRVKVTTPRTKPLASASNDMATIPVLAGGRSPRIQRDPRIPPPGTRLIRKIGGKKLECVVESGGFRFNGNVYGSLSAAASAAARVAKIFPSQNGYVFWRIVRQTKSPLLALARKFERYESALLRALTSRSANSASQEASKHIERINTILRDAAKVGRHD